MATHHLEVGPHLGKDYDKSAMQPLVSERVAHYKNGNFMIMLIVDNFPRQLASDSIDF